MIPRNNRTSFNLNGYLFNWFYLFTDPRDRITNVLPISRIGAFENASSNIKKIPTFEDIIIEAWKTRIKRIAFIQQCWKINHLSSSTKTWAGAVLAWPILHFIFLRTSRSPVANASHDYNGQLKSAVSALSERVDQNRTRANHFGVKIHSDLKSESKTSCATYYPKDWWFGVILRITDFL